MKTRGLQIMLIAVVIFSIAAQKVKVVNEIFGSWKYTISDVPPEYESGFLTFEEKDGKAVGYVGDVDKEEMQELVVDQEKVSFATSFDGSLIKYKLTLSGDTLTGSVSTQYGEFPMKAVRQPKK